MNLGRNSGNKLALRETPLRSPGVHSRIRHSLPCIWIFPVLTTGFVKNVSLTRLFGVDTTLLACAVLVVVSLRFADQGWQTRLRKLWPLLVFVATLLPAISNSGSNAYSTRKLLLLFGLTLPVAIAVVLLAGCVTRVFAVLVCFISAGVLAAVIAATSGGSAREFGRLAVGDDVLALGYPSAAAAAVIAAMTVNKRIRPLVGFPLFLALAVMTFASGSRGALFGLIIALLLMLTTSRRFSVGLVIASLGVVVFVVQLWDYLPYASRFRLETTNLDATSIAMRVHLYRHAWQLFLDFPISGVGIGHFSDIGLRDYRYPHNIFLEVAAEAGFLGLVGLGVFSMAVLLAWLNRGNTGEWFALRSISVVVFCEALFSGDITNREWWMVGLLILSNAMQANHDGTNACNSSRIVAHAKLNQPVPKR